MSSQSGTSRPPGTFRFGRVAGADLLARPSLLLMGVVLVVLFAPRFDVGPTNPYALAAVFVVALYVSVLVHELAHLALARIFGMRVPTVTLHLLGGETAIEGESRTPWQELATSIVGPLASAAIGAGALALVGDVHDGVGDDVLWSIGWVNLLVAAFNMLPGLPLDGGRVARSVVWALTGREDVGIRAAAWLGRLAAVGVVAVVAWVVLTRDADDLRWVADVLVGAFVALFLWQGASAALGAADRTSRINRLHAGRLAEPLDPTTSPAPDTPRLPHDLQGSMLLRAMAVRPSEEYLIVDHDGRETGLLRSARVDEAYRSGR